MKTFVIINGKQLLLLHRDSLEDARNCAINVCNHSEEVIVREIEEVTDFTTIKNK